MTIKEFQKKYTDNGGIVTLTEMRSLFYTQNYIAKHFGVTLATVRLWMLEFFGTPYDPRPDRGEAIVANMVAFAKNNPIEDFKQAFKRSDYFDRALEEVAKQNIYGDVK